MKKNVDVVFWLAKIDGLQQLILSDHEPCSQLISGEESLLLNESFWVKLSGLTGNNIVARYVYFLTSFIVSLRFFSNEEDIAVLVPELNVKRNFNPGNINLLRVSDGTQQTVREFLNHVKAQVLEVLDHQGYDFDLLNEQSMAVNQAPIRHFTDIGFCDSTLQSIEGLQRCAAVLYFGHEQQVVLKYRDFRGDKRYVRRFLRCYEMVLSTLIDNMDVPLQSLSLMDAAEREMILHSFNDTATTTVDDTYVGLFEQQVALTPDAIAVVCDTTRRSYREINESANRLSGVIGDRLVDKGGSPAVAVMMSRSADIVEIVLAIWKCGGVYVPVATDCQTERILSMLEDASISAVIYDRAEVDAERQRLIAEKTVSLEWQQLQLDALQQDGNNPKPERDINALSYIIFTSGSTGRPKGVMVEYCGMMNHLMAKIKTLQLDHRSHVAQNAPFVFDISVWQLFAVLLTGGRVTIFKQDVINNVEKFSNAVRHDKITVLEVVPSYLTAMMSFHEKNDGKILFPELLYLLVTGETMKKADVEKWFHLTASRIPMLNAYGPTEASDDVAHHIMYEPPCGDLVPIGKPIQNTRIYILNKYDQLCPVGVIGEICVAGICVGRGYVNAPEMTGRVFLKDPFHSPHRLYKTGDKGCFLQDGTILFFGREDRQVKIAGNRIELEEIEHTIAGVEGVLAVAVITAGGDEEAKYIKAFLVLKEECTIDFIKERLRATLPSYSIPSVFIEVQDIPLTANGKVDYGRLKRDEGYVADLDAFFVPDTPLKLLLAEIWEEVLGKGEVRNGRDFFESGGNSLQAVQLIIRIKKALMVNVEMEDIFNHPTISDLAAYILTLQKEVVSDILPAPTAERYELSPSQRGLWLIDRIEGVDAGYNICEAFAIHGSDFDHSIFSESYKLLVERHEILRTTFTEDGFQKVHTDADTFVDLTIWNISDNDQQDDLIKGCIEREANRVFDLTKGPLIRLILIEKSDNERVLLLTMHHIISDRWSFYIIRRDLVNLYAAQLRRLDYPEPLKFQYKDFSFWKNRYLEQTNLEGAATYWAKLLARQIPLVALPADIVAPMIKTSNGGSVHQILSEETFSRIRQLCGEVQISPFVFLLSAIKVLWNRYMNTTDIIIGCAVSERDFVELEDQIGFYVNTIVFRSVISEKDTFRSFLEQTKSQVLQAMRFRNYPFPELVKKNVVNRDPARSAIFDIGFTFHSRIPVEMPGLQDLVITEYPYAVTRAKTALWFHAEQVDDTLEVRLEYNTDLFRPVTASVLLKRFCLLVDQLMASPHGQIAAYHVILPEEAALRSKPRLSFDLDL